MTLVGGTARALGGALAVAVGTQVAPALTAVTPLRRAVLPRLSGTSRRRHVALTFDDGPDPESTPVFLQILEDLGWKATFFVLGDMVRRAPGLAVEVVTAGHELAVHGDEHRSMLRRAPGEIHEDLVRCRDTISAATGVEPRFFRPPFGMLSGGAVRAARRLDLETTLWTSWGRDWRPEATPGSVTDDVLRGRVDGGTVLLHDSDCTSAPGSWHAAAGALPRLADVFASRSLKVGPLVDHFPN